MNSFAEVVERVKDIISKEIDGRVLDIHAADAMELKINVLRVYKSINKMPASHVIAFCEKRAISLDWMLFGKSVKAKKLNLD